MLLPLTGRSAPQSLPTSHCPALLLQAIEEAEVIGQPDVAELVRAALEELEHPRYDLEEHE